MNRQGSAHADTPTRWAARVRLPPACNPRRSRRRRARSRARRPARCGGAPGPGAVTAAGLLLSTTALALWHAAVPHAQRPPRRPALRGRAALSARDFNPYHPGRRGASTQLSRRRATRPRAPQDPTAQGLQNAVGWAAPLSGRSVAASSALVADQDRRLVQIRTVDALVHGRSTVTTPYPAEHRHGVLAGADGPGARRTPSGTCSRWRHGPSLRQPGGAYLLSENIFIRPGATLSLTSPGALVLRLASDSKGFSSLVNDGGMISLVTGTERAPAQVTSWDRVKGAPRPLHPRRQGLPALHRRAGHAHHAREHARSRLLEWPHGRPRPHPGRDPPSTGSSWRTPRTPVRRANRDAFTLKPATGAKAVKGSARRGRRRPCPCPLAPHRGPTHQPRLRDPGNDVTNWMGTPSASSSRTRGGR